MSKTIKAIERHMILPVRSKTRHEELGPRSKIQPIRNRERNLVAECHRGVEILEHVQRKLRLAFAPPQSLALATLSY